MFEWNGVGIVTHRIPRSKCISMPAWIIAKINSRWFFLKPFGVIWCFCHSVELPWNQNWFLKLTSEHSILVWRGLLEEVARLFSMYNNHSSRKVHQRVTKRRWFYFWPSSYNNERGYRGVKRQSTNPVTSCSDLVPKASRAEIWALHRIYVVLVIIRVNFTLMLALFRRA